MDTPNRNIKKLVTLGALILGLLLAYMILVSLSRQGEQKVTFTVIPSDASLLVNDKPIKQGDNYLSSGDYTLKATKDGWKESTKKFKVSDESLNVSVALEPDSEQSKQYLRDNPDIQMEREKIGGENFSDANNLAQENNPIISQLPYSDLMGPFSIDYGPSKTREGGIFLLVTDSTPPGRIEALKWIRTNGQNPTDLEIVFSDFINPLDERVDAH